jgi:hypothetical protein
MEVQRAAVQADADFSRAGIAGIWTIFQHEAIETSRGVQDHCFHRQLLKRPGLCAQPFANDPHEDPVSSEE